MGVPKTAPQRENSRAVTVTWGDLDALPLLFSNQILGQARPQEGIMYLAFGHAATPPFVGSPDEIRKQAEALEQIEIKPLARLAMTPEGVREVIQVLRSSLEKYERGVA
jgi:hypothetical protein